MSSNVAVLRHRGYSGSVHVSLEDGCIHGRILHIDDIVSYEGQTVVEVQAEFVAAVDRYLEHCAAVGKEPNRPFSGTLNVRLGPELHRSLAEVASATDITINAAICQAVDLFVQGPRPPSSPLRWYKTIFFQDGVPSSGEPLNKVQQFSGESKVANTSSIPQSIH